MPAVELERAPSLRGLYARAAAGLLPGRRATSDTVPDTRLSLAGVAVDRERLAGYTRLCGFALRDTLPPTYPHVLAFPMALSLMTAPGFPFPAAAVVHLANRIEHHRAVGVDERLDLVVHAEALRPHRRGRQVDVVAVATVDGVPVWRDVSTYLHRERPPGSSSAGDGDGGAGRDPAPEPAAPTAVWRVEAGVGRAYAAVSGDRNPLHTSTLAARVFGFRRRIAHGMWTKARCLAHLAPRLPEAFAVDVTFRAPVLLPSTVHFRALPADGGWRLALHDARSGRAHLFGAVSGVSSGR